MAVPRVGDFGYVRTPNLTGARGVSPGGIEIDLSPLARALEGVGEMQLRQKDAAQKLAYRKEVGQTGLDLKQLKLQLLQENDPLTAPDVYKERARDLENKATERLNAAGLGHRADEFITSFREASMSEEYDLRTAAIQYQNQEHKAALRVSLDNFAKLAGEGDTVQSETYKAQGIAAIEEAVQSGAIGPVEGAESEMKLKEDIVTTRVQNDAFQNPSATRARLQSGEYADLHPAERGKWIRWTEQELETRAREARAEANRIQAEQERRMAELRAQVRVQYEDELEAASRGEVADPNTVKSVIGAFGDKAGPLLERLNLAKETFNASVGMAMKSPEELSAIIASRAPSGPGYKAEAAMQEMLVKAAEDTLRSRQADPASSVANAFPSIANSIASENPAEVANGIRQAAEVQTSVYGMDRANVQLLSKAMAETIVNRYNAAPDPETKLETLLHYANDKLDEQTAGTVLNQLQKAQLPNEARLAVLRERTGDHQAAIDILNSVGSKATIGDIETVTADALKQSLRTSASVGATGASAAMTQATSDARYAQAFAQDQATIEKMAIMYTAAGMKPEEAVKRAKGAVEGDAKRIVAPGLAVVKVPAEYDQGKVHAGLASLKTQLPLFVPSAEIAALVTPTVTTGPLTTSIPNPILERASKDLLDDWAEQGVFVNEGDSGFALMVPIPRRDKYGNVLAMTDMKKLPMLDGKPRVFSIDQVLKIQEAPGASLISPAEATPMGDLGGGAGDDRLQMKVGTNPVNVAAGFLDRIAGNKAAKTSADVPLTAEQAKALGIPSNKKKKEPQS